MVGTKTSEHRGPRGPSLRTTALGQNGKKKTLILLPPKVPSSIPLWPAQDVGFNDQHEIGWS